MKATELHLPNPHKKYKTRYFNIRHHLGKQIFHITHGKIDLKQLEPF